MAAAEVIIIGGGVIGLSSAVALAAAGYAPLLLAADGGEGAGASGCAPALLLPPTGRLAAALQRHPPAPALRHLIRRALNRTPTLALRAEAQRKERGLTVEAAAAEIGIPADSFARYVRSGRGLTAEQRARVAAWAHPGDPGKRSGEALHAAAALEEIAARAGLTVDDGRAALEALIADLAPP